MLRENMNLSKNVKQLILYLNPGFHLPGWERLTPVSRPGDDYTKAALRVRITHQRGLSAAGYDYLPDCSS